jgi:DnaK suppressor protein
MVIERASDPTDEAQHAFDRELTIRALDRESGHLAAIRIALQRIAERSYGICEGCEHEIALQRLFAVPWTGYCVRCQENIDRGNVSHREWSFDLNDAA